MSSLWLVSYVALWILFLTVAVVLVSVLRNMGTLYEALERGALLPDQIKLVDGKLTPELALQTLDGDSVTTVAFHGQVTALTFINPNCGPCRDLLRDLAAHGFDQAAWKPATTQAIVSLDDPSATRDLLRKLNLPQDVAVFTASRETVEAAWGVRSTPTTMVLGTQGEFIRHKIGYTARTDQPVEMALGA